MKKANQVTEFGKVDATTVEADSFKAGKVDATAAEVNSLKADTVDAVTVATDSLKVGGGAREVSTQVWLLKVTKRPPP